MQWLWYFVCDRVRNRRIVLSVERAAARDQFIENHTQREEIGARVGPFPLDLLRRHIGGSAHRRSFTRQLRCPAPSRQAKVGDLDMSFGREEDVGRLDIAMNYVLFVRRR